MLTDPPRTLPAGLTSLSVSAVGLFMRDPYKWRRRYIDHDYEPVSPALIVGAAVGRAEGTSYQQQISDGQRLWLSEVRDVYSDEFDLKVDEESHRGGIEWEGERPGRVKDSGIRVLERYHRDVAPHVTPLSVERRFEISLPHVDWTFTGYIDLEAAIGRVVGVDDFKARGHQRGPVSPEEADGDLQPTGYLFAKRAEAEALALASEAREAARARAAGVFRYHSLVRPRIGAARPRDVAITPTARTDEQLDTFLALLYSVAAEIVWRVETDTWRGARADDPLCSPRYCGFWASCPYGGAHRPLPSAARPLPVRRPTADDVVDAVKATARRDKTTTAQRVAAHLGVSTRSASNSLAALCRRGVLARKTTKRKGSRPVTAYSVLDDGTVERQLAASVATNGKPAPRQEVLAP